MSKKNLTIEEFRKLSDEEQCERYCELSSHDKFIARITAPLAPVSILCNDCKHYRGYKEAGVKCDAFPDGIPKSHLIRGEDENYRVIHLTKEMAENCHNGIGFERIAK